MLKFKKLSAAVMATAMAATMAVGTAISASAADINVSAYETTAASSVSVTSQGLIWNPASDGTCTISNFGLYKASNPSSISMANGAITGVKLTKSGSNYTLVLDTKAIENTFLGIKYSATIKTITAEFYGGATVTATQNGNQFTITFPASYGLPWIGETSSNGYQNSLQLNFTTTMEDGSVAAILPDAMKNPQAFFMFTTPSTLN